MVVDIHMSPKVYDYSTINIGFILIREIIQAAVPIFCVSSVFFLIDKNLSDKEKYFIISPEIRHESNKIANLC